MPIPHCFPPHAFLRPRHHPRSRDRDLVRDRGRADRFASPQSVDQLRACIEVDPNLRVLGEGANLLVDDAGVSDLVVSLNAGEFKATEFDERERTLRVGAGWISAR